MQIFVDNKRVKIRGKTVSDMLSELGINSETVLIQRKNELITEEQEKKKNDRIFLINVISGG